MNLTLGLSSENTALPDHHYYHHMVESLPTGESASLRFEFNLSALEQTATSSPAASEPSYKILRISTTTAGGALDGRDGNPAALIPYWSPCSSAARARTPGIGTRVFKLGSFTRPTRARASPPTSTALFRSMRARV
jgi:hypothetical protein